MQSDFAVRVTLQQFPIVASGYTVLAPGEERCPRHICKTFNQLEYFNQICSVTPFFQCPQGTNQDAGACSRKVAYAYTAKYYKRSFYAA